MSASPGNQHASKLLIELYFAELRLTIRQEARRFQKRVVRKDTLGARSASGRREPCLIQHCREICVYDPSRADTGLQRSYATTEKRVITVINASSRSKTPTSGGNVRNILAPADDGTRVHVAIEDLDAHKISHLHASDRTRVVYVMEGQDAEISHKVSGKTTTYPAKRRSGLYLEPAEEATIKASGTPLVILSITVPKHTRKTLGATAGGTGNEPPRGYFFEEANLQALVDERRIRTRTFWVNKETGLSGSWDLQLGRMYYAPHGYSPRHMHNASKTSSITPEHFYFIEKGTGEVKHDNGAIPVGPGSLILIPSGEWHQLLASETGLDYIEFQAPFDFVTTMDHDPLGKNWYIQGTDDGSGNPKLWVQS